MPCSAGARRSKHQRARRHVPTARLTGRILVGALLQLLVIANELGDGLTRGTAGYSCATIAARHGADLLGPRYIRPGAQFEPLLLFCR